MVWIVDKGQEMKVWVVVYSNYEMDRPTVTVHTNPTDAYKEVIKWISDDDEEAVLADQGKFKEAAELLMSKHDPMSRIDLYEVNI